MTSYSGMNPEITDSYRRTLIFNNSLLIREYSERYDFRVSEKVRKMRAQGVSEEKIAKYEQRQVELKPRREERYRTKLEANVEPTVRRYASSIMGFIRGEPPD
ncbi:hypothetical protein ES703_102197 [subsurface metagenome]